jgi:hypothetical protein
MVMVPLAPLLMVSIVPLVVPFVLFVVLFVLFVVLVVLVVVPIVPVVVPIVPVVVPIVLIVSLSQLLAKYVHLIWAKASCSFHNSLSYKGISHTQLMSHEMSTCEA